MESSFQLRALFEATMSTRVGGLPGFVDCRSESTSPPHSKRRKVNSGQAADLSHTPILRYAIFLKGVYRSATTSTDKFPHLPSSKYINLALVRKEQVCRSKADIFTKATLHGRIDEILKKKEPIPLEDFLIPTEGQPDMKCVLLEGAPGIGKSTCVWELCRRWEEISALRKYSLVILLRLREKRVQEAQCVKDLCYHRDAELRQAVAAEIEVCEGRGVLFILDGFDELPASLRKESMLVELIHGTYLSQCTVLVTSRPSATADLLSVAQPQIHKQIEVVGFTLKKIEEYARAFFASEKDVFDDFLKYIITNPAIRSMMYIPLICAMVVEIYGHSRTADIPIPQTMTQLYVEMSLTLLKRYLDGKDDMLAKELPEDLEDLPPQLKEPFNSLAKLAYEGMVRGEVILDELPDGCNHFGFLNSATELYMGETASTSYSFLHLTLQEFLAAFHISQLSPSDQHSVAVDHAFSRSWVEVLKFAVGLCGIVGTGWEDELAWHNCEGDVSTRMVELLYEAQDSIDYMWLLGAYEHFVGNNCNLTPFDCYCIGHCVAHSSNTEWRLNMEHYTRLSDSLVEMFKYGLYSSPTREYDNILSLELRDCGLTSISFDILVEIIPLMRKLKELNVGGNPVGEGGLVNLLHSLSHLSIEILDIGRTSIGCTDIEALSPLITQSGYMKELRIGDTNMSAECTELMLKIALSPSSLQSVKLWDVSPTEQVMTLESDNFTDNIVESLAEMLKVNNTLVLLEWRVLGVLKVTHFLALNAALKYNHTLYAFQIFLKHSPGFSIEKTNLDRRLRL